MLERKNAAFVIGPTHCLPMLSVAAVVVIALAAEAVDVVDVLVAVANVLGEVQVVAVACMGRNFQEVDYWC